MRAGRRVQVIASGAAVGPIRAASREPGGAEVVVADGGLAAALAAGVVPDLVVGDLDSADPAQLATVDPDRVVRSPVDKDESDLELALAAACARGATEIRVHLADGGRLDHALANLAVLASPRWADADVVARVGDHTAVHVVRGTHELDLPVGTPLALQAVGGPAVVTSTGVAFPLRGESLDPFTARGIANRVTGSPVRIEVAQGVVLVIVDAPPTRGTGEGPTQTGPTEPSGSGESGDSAQA